MFDYDNDTLCTSAAVLFSPAITSTTPTTSIPFSNLSLCSARHLSTSKTKHGRSPKTTNC